HRPAVRAHPLGRQARCLARPHVPLLGEVHRRSRPRLVVLPGRTPPRGSVMGPFGKGWQDGRRGHPCVRASVATSARAAPKRHAAMPLGRRPSRANCPLGSVATSATGTPTPEPNGPLPPASPGRIPHENVLIPTRRG